MDQASIPRAPLPGAGSLEANLEICQEEARKALARAEAIDPTQDEYGNLKSNAYNVAVRFLKMSAKLGFALAKLKGEHTSIIRIYKTETVEREAAPTLPPALNPRGFLDAPRPERLQAAWEQFTRENFGWEWDATGAKSPGEGDPPAISEGSNTEK